MSDASLPHCASCGEPEYACECVTDIHGLTPHRPLSPVTERQRRWYARQKAGIIILQVPVAEARLLAVLEDVGLVGPEPSRTELDMLAAGIIDDALTRYETERWGGLD
jgi:hypothetical protein